MVDKHVLAQSAPGDTLTVLYTVPADKVATVAGVFVTNATASALWASISVGIDGAADALSQHILKQDDITTPDVFGRGLLLSTDDELRVRGEDANVVFTASIIESTKD
jgi:hypothetical protein